MATCYLIVYNSDILLYVYLSKDNPCNSSTELQMNWWVSFHGLAKSVEEGYSHTHAEKGKNNVALSARGIKNLALHSRNKKYICQIESLRKFELVLHHAYQQGTNTAFHCPRMPEEVPSQSSKFQRGRIMGIGINRGSSQQTIISYGFLCTAQTPLFCLDHLWILSIRIRNCVSVTWILAGNETLIEVKL